MSHKMDVHGCLKIFSIFPKSRVRFPQVEPITNMKAVFRAALIAIDQRAGWLAPSGFAIVARAAAETDV
jgi:hypothetical protein